MAQFQEAPAASRPMMSLPQAVRQCLRKYANFSGRATRAEFWWWSLVCYLAIAMVAVLDGVLSALFVALGIPFISPLGLLLAVGVFLPSLAVAVRRLHDIGKSGWWLLLWYAIYLVASLTILVSVFVLLFLLAFGAMGGSDFRENVTGTGGQVVVIFFLIVGGAMAAMLLVCIWALVWLVKQGQNSPNRYGADPRTWEGEGMGEV